MRTALFITCFNDVLFPRTGEALVRILEGLGHQVTFPPEQTCCGQIHFNTGYRREAGRLMAKFVQDFAGAEVVVAPSASCVAMVREQYPVLAAASGDPGLEEEVAALGERVFELSELLVHRWGVEDVGASFPGRVALHPTCHSTRGIDVGDAPTRLLRAVRGLELADLPFSEECCGFGGTFSVKNPHTSLAMLSDKIQGIRDSGAEVVTAVDNSCLMHISGGLRRAGLLRQSGGRRAPGGMAPGGMRPKDGAVRSKREPGVRVMHLAEILVQREGAGRE